MRRLSRPIFAGLIAIALSGCAGAAPATPSERNAVDARTAVIHRSPSCSCCGAWEAYLRGAGWQVTTVDEADPDAFKTGLGLPVESWSCHTALIEGYVVEGHVPLAAIEDLLAQRPAITGIALPGMPAGSPGMPGAQEAPFVVLSISDSVIAPFGSY